MRAFREPPRRDERERSARPDRDRRDGRSPDQARERVRPLVPETGQARERARPAAPETGQASRPPDDGPRQRIDRRRVSDAQRLQVRRAVLERRGARLARRHAGFTPTVGSRVPRRHRLHHLTPAILAFAPLYSGYSYIVVEDTVCIVDPETYVVVDVISAEVEEAGSPAPRSQPPALSAEEMRFVAANVPRDDVHEDLRVRLALGATIPARIELLHFPEIVLERLPRLARYRFVVVEEDVVIVDPSDRSVVLVITS